MSASVRSVVRGREHEFCQVGEGQYRLTIVSLGLQFDVDRLRRERSELIGELTVACDLAGARTIDGLLSVADWNLSSAHARTQRAKLLAERSEAPEVDWGSYLEELAQRTITAERAGAPSAPVHTFEAPGRDLEYDIDGWRLLRDHATIAFGDGGSLKSYLALYGAARLAREGVVVLYADWELGGADHRDRLERLCGLQMPTIHYLRCDRPMTIEADRISREARRLSVTYLICDSVAFAVGGPPENAEHAMAYFRAIRQLGIGSLHLAHVNRSESGDQKPFGSSFWHNSARSTWFVKLATASPSAEQLTIGLFCRKSNLTRLHPAVGFQFGFRAMTTTVERVNVAGVEELATQLPTWQRMVHLLRSGPSSIAELAEELDVRPDTIRRAVRSRIGQTLFQRLPSPEGVPRLALVERSTERL